MCEFKSWKSFWDFECSVKKKTRFFYETEITDFLSTVLETGKKRKKLIKPENILYRAQLGYDNHEIDQDGVAIDIPVPYQNKRMKPHMNKATEGRANPKGIPYMYLSTNGNTALAEVRPWIGSKISLGTFIPVRKLSIINCTVNEGRNLIFLKEPSVEKKEESVWNHIDKAFAKPISQCDAVSDYVPTQIIAEFFKANGYDGLAYRSSLGGGHNIVLFDLDSVKLVDLYLFELKTIDFNFEIIQNEFTTGGGGVIRIDN